MLIYLFVIPAFHFPLLDYAMSQPDVLSQIQPEGEHSTDDQPRPEASEIPADASEGKRKEYILLNSFSWSEKGA